MKENVVIDVGAYIGVTVMDIYHKYPDSEIYAFEPCRTSFRQLSHNLGKAPRVTLVNEAVDIENTTTNFNETYARVCASLLKPCAETCHLSEASAGKMIMPDHDDHAFDIVDSYDVKCTRMDSFMEREQIKSVEYIKVDAQGRDLNVIKSFGSRLVDVKSILAEARLTDFSMYEGDCHKDELVQFMEENGFKIVSTSKQTHNQEENILFDRNWDTR
jgi:FkbM family methyltransferase